MSYQVLARKWRPRTFAALVGQEHVVRALTHALDQRRLHHAYLFTGTRGVGKTTLARILAKSLNCETGITSKPCGECSSCVEIDAGRFVDLVEVDAATNTRVDEMRQLLDNAIYAPTRGRFKVYVIDEVHMLSNSAFNAMLKTLEEPPEHIKFILATTDPQKIPVTVLSRCLQFNLKHMPAASIAAHLERVLAAEQIDAEPGAAGLIAHAARGSMRDALSLLDQAIAYAGGSVTEEAVRAMLGTVDTGQLFEVLEAVVARDAVAALKVADAMQGRGLSFDSALAELARLLHQVALAQSAPEAVAGDAPERERLLALAQAIDPEDVQLYYQIVLHGRADLPLAPDEYAGFAMTLLRLVAFAPEVTGGPAEARGAVAPRRAAAGPAPAAAFAGDWPALVRGLALAGAAKQLAERSELVRWSDGLFELSIAPESRAFADKTNVERLRAALAQALGREVQVRVALGAVVGPTVAGLVGDERRAQQAAADEQVDTDPFVRELIASFGATIESIQPVGKAVRP